MRTSIVLSTERGFNLFKTPATFLPRTEVVPMETAPRISPNGQKTILVVDDNPEILTFVSGFLASSSYRVLTANCGSEALQRSRDYQGEIHLLLSDFQMPGMSGIDLASHITAERPKIKVLMMSGFEGGMLVLNEGWHFLAKPFIPSQLKALVVGLVSPEKDSRFLAVNMN